MIKIPRKLVITLEENMNKEEILSKSKKENIYGDEREKRIRMNRDVFSAWGVIVLGIIMMIMKLFRGHSPADIISLFFCMSGMGFIYEGVKLKKRVQIAAGIVFLLLAAYYFYKFCKGLL